METIRGAADGSVGGVYEAGGTVWVCLSGTTYILYEHKKVRTSSSDLILKYKNW